MASRLIALAMIAGAACRPPAPRSDPPRPPTAVDAAVAAPPAPPPTLRLPGTVAPTGYQLTLAIDPARASFDGAVVIDLALTEPTAVVWLHADALMKATKVEGVYDSDPAKNPDAQMYRRLSYDRFLADRVGVMDSTAVTLCRDNKLPIRVFALHQRGNIKRVVMGEDVGTIVSETGE